MLLPIFDFDKAIYLRDLHCTNTKEALDSVSIFSFPTPNLQLSVPSATGDPSTSLLNFAKLMELFFSRANVPLICRNSIRMLHKMVKRSRTICHAL